MDDLISRQGVIDALRVAYLDDNIQSAKDDPCIVDAMTDWAIRQVKELPSAQTELPFYVAEIEEEYQKAVKSPYIHNALAKALYEVWKKYDREDVSEE